MNSRHLFVLLSTLTLAASFFASPLLAAPPGNKIEFVVSAGTHDRKNTPVSLEVSVDPALKNATAAIVKDDSGSAIAAQLVTPSLLATPNSAKGGVARELHFILPELKAGQTKNFTATISPEAQTQRGQFSWHDTKGEYEDLAFDGRPVLRYMYHKLDESSKEARDATFKPYHHVYDPEGKQLLTKGPGGLYPHHHGVFYGFKDVTYDGGEKCDIWHCPNAYQEHDKFLNHEAGPLLARQLVEINWVGEPKLPESASDAKAGKKSADSKKADAKKGGAQAEGKSGTSGEGTRVFAKEQREMTVYNLPGGTMIEFASRLTPVLGPIKLDGDPQHSGFHFRSAQEVADKTAKQTYYLRPDGKGELDETRNWDAKSKDPKTVNLPWNAMSIVLGGKRYTVAYLDDNKNPKEARYSERDYGRFGSYFVADVKPDKPLDVNYRLWVQDGEMTVPQVAALDADFDDPPLASIK